MKWPKWSALIQAGLRGGQPASAFWITTAQLAAATGRFSDGSGRGSICLPHEEVRLLLPTPELLMRWTPRRRPPRQVRMHHGDWPRIDRRLTTEYLNKRIDLSDTVLHRYISRDQHAGDPAVTSPRPAGVQDGRRVGPSRVRRPHRHHGHRRRIHQRRVADVGGWALANYFAEAAVLPPVPDVARISADVERLAR